MAYMAMVNTRDSTQGMVKIWETKATRHGKQLARHSWDVTPALISQRRKQWFPRWLKHPRRQDVVRRPAGPLLRTGMASRGFLSY